MHSRSRPVPDVRLSNEEIADLHNALDILRQVYAEEEFAQKVIDQYKPGTRGLIAPGSCT